MISKTNAYREHYFVYWLLSKKYLKPILFMKCKRISFFAFVLFACISWGCQDSTNQANKADEGSSSENTTEAQNTEKDVMKVSPPENPEPTQDDFAIMSKDDFVARVIDHKGNPLTWEAQNQDYIFFRADGSMAGGGVDGEGSMWEGTWIFENGQLTVTSDSELAKNQVGTYRVRYYPDDGALEVKGVEYTVAKF